jgi:pimeloyl-ACP methyl ester carboxylesterase
MDRQALFHPERTQADPSIAERVDGLERWWIDGDQLRVEAWYLPPLTPHEGPGPALIYAHGNESLIEQAVRTVEPYRRMGLAVLLPEYRGYGRSSGSPSEAGIEHDFERFYDRLVERPEVDPARVVFHGHSLGGGVVGVLASRRNAAALVLESTFTNVPDLASQWMVPAGFVRDRFDTRAVLTRASMPVLIVHGLEDDIVPFKHARELHRVAWDSRLVGVPHAGHSVPHDDEFWGRVRAFLSEAHVLDADDAPAEPLSRR